MKRDYAPRLCHMVLDPSTTSSKHQVQRRRTQSTETYMEVWYFSMIRLLFRSPNILIFGAITRYCQAGEPTIRFGFGSTPPDTGLIR